MFENPRRMSIVMQFTGRFMVLLISWDVHTVARTRAKTPDAHCAFGEQSRATGLQMTRMNSTIPAPAITISEAAPAPAQKPAAQSSA